MFACQAVEARSHFTRCEVQEDNVMAMKLLTKINSLLCAGIRVLILRDTWLRIWTVLRHSA